MPKINKLLINSKNLAGKTVLHEAAKQGNLNFIKLLLKSNADVNSSDEMGRSPLSDAILTDRVEAVIMLLKNGASPVQQDMYGKTPLHEAVFSSPESITHIRKAGGNPLSRDFSGKTPFVLSLNKNLRMIDDILGEDRFLVDTDGDSPLHIAIKEKVSPEIFNKIIKKGYPVNKRNKNGTTAILLSVQYNQKENTHSLLIAGSDPFIINNQGLCAVGEIFNNKPYFVSIVAEFAINKTDVMGEGILHYAAKFADLKTIKELLQFPGIYINAKSTAGETAYDIALRWNRLDAADLLKVK